MVYDQGVVDRYAMKAEEMANVSARLGWAVPIYEVGEALGLTKEESNSIATYLQNAGWVKCNYAGAPPTLVVTDEGRKNIKKLRWPKWRRWVDEHSTTMMVFWMFASAIGGGLVVLVFQHFLFK